MYPNMQCAICNMQRFFLCVLNSFDTSLLLAVCSVASQGAGRPTQHIVSKQLQYCSRRRRRRSERGRGFCGRFGVWRVRFLVE